MRPTDREILALSTHLQANLLAFGGKHAGPRPRFEPRLLIPVAVIVGAAVLFGLSSKARKSALLQVVMLMSTRLLQTSTHKQTDSN